LAVAIVAVCGLELQKALDHRRTAERVEHIVGASRDFFRVLQDVRTERGGLANAVSSPAVIPPAGAPAFRARFAASEKVYAAVLAMMDQDASGATRAEVREIRARHAAWLAVRAEATAAVHRPSRSGRPTSPTV
jgi:hypothetical protein